jgi:hypothetical protein
MKDYLAEKPQQEIAVTRNVLTVPTDNILNLVEQQQTVDGHKVPLDIELEHVAIATVVVGTRTNEVICAPDAVRRAFSRATTVAIVDEEPLEDRIDVIEKEMMNNPVAEMRGENLPLHRLKGDETHARPNRVRAAHDFFVKGKQVALVMHLEPESAFASPLVPPGVEVCLKKVLYAHRCPGVRSFRQRTEKPLSLSFVLRLTVALPEFRLRFHALAPLGSEDQKLPFVLRLLNDPLVLR